MWNLSYTSVSCFHGQRANIFFPPNISVIKWNTGNGFFCNCFLLDSFLFVFPRRKNTGLKMELFRRQLYPSPRLRPSLVSCKTDRTNGTEHHWTLQNKKEEKMNTHRTYEGVLNQFSALQWFSVFFIFVHRSNKLEKSCTYVKGNWWNTSDQIQQAVLLGVLKDTNLALVFALLHVYTVTY